MLYLLPIFLLLVSLVIVRIFGAGVRLPLVAVYILAVAGSYALSFISGEPLAAIWGALLTAPTSFVIILLLAQLGLGNSLLMIIALIFAACLNTYFLWFIIGKVVRPVKQ